MKRNLVIIFILALSMSLRAQFNYLEMSNKAIYFGITMGLNVADYKIIHSPNVPQNDSIKYVKSALGPGINLGIIGNYQFHKYFDLRFIPTLSFSDKSIVYWDLYNNVSEQDITSIYLDFPAVIRFKSQPIKDFRIYVIGGGRYDYDLASNVKARRAENIVKVKRNDASAELGAGVMIYFPYFIMSPEIKWDQGFINILAPTPGLIYSRTFRKDLFQNFYVYTES